MTRQLLDRLSARKKIYIVAATYREKLIVRFVVCSRFSKEEDIHFAWNEIVSQASEIVQNFKPTLKISILDDEPMTKENGDRVTKFEGLKIDSEKEPPTIS